MSNRTLVELNHDYTPDFNDETKMEWVTAICRYMASGDPQYLPRGVTFKSRRHHTEPCPLDEHQMVHDENTAELIAALDNFFPGLQEYVSELQEKS